MIRIDSSNYYKIMCQRAVELQVDWKPQEGDFFSTVSSFCDQNNDCSEEKMCDDCVKYTNTFVISGKYDYHDSVGGTHWFFGGNGCVRGDGNRVNSTSCSVMTRNGISDLYDDYTTSSLTDKVWLPRQDQLQNMLWSGLTKKAKVRAFIDYLDTEAEPNAFNDSLESLWLSLFMKVKYKKNWNRISNIQQWEGMDSEKNKGY